VNAYTPAQLRRMTPGQLAVVAILAGRQAEIKPGMSKADLIKVITRRS